MKKVLILCTGNSCRSIIAEALVNRYLKDIKAYSAGSRPSGKVNENAIKVLKEEGAWSDGYYSKSIDEVIKEDFELVVTVCDNAKESCPVFPKKTKILHIPFDDPDGKEYEEFVKTKELIKSKLLPVIQKELELKKEVKKTVNGVKISFQGAIKKENIIKMVENCATGQCECMSTETKKKIKDMSVSGEDGEVELNLLGEITKEEIEEALKKSKVLNG